MTDTKVSFHIPEDVKNAYKDLCKSKGTNISNRLRLIIYKDLEDWKLVGTTGNKVNK